MVGGNFLFVISAPSGTGKTTICRYLLGLHKELVLSTSATTREPRNLEKDGVDYFFLSKNEFEKRVENNEFLEYAKVFENYYGTPVSFVEEKLREGKNVIFDIDWQGMRKIKQANRFNVSTIFLVPPSMDALRARLKGRGDSDEQIEKRISGFHNDAEKAGEYDYVIINDDLNEACQQIGGIYTAEMMKWKKQEQIKFINDVLMK